MRGGRPCSCGCGCIGFNCVSVSIAGDVCPADGAFVYGNFHEPFSGILESGWDGGNYLIEGGYGVHSSGDYTYDHYSGSAYRDPVRCASLKSSATFKYSNRDTGYGKIGIDSGPSIILHSGDVLLKLPDDSDLIIGQYGNNENYLIQMDVSRVPSNFYLQNLTIKKRTNNITSGGAWCSGSMTAVTPYSGCPYLECTIFTSGFNEKNESVYPLTGSFGSSIEISGDWRVDDFCTGGAESSVGRCFGDFYGNSGALETWPDCAPSCDYVIPKQVFTYNSPCQEDRINVYDNGEDFISVSGEIIYLLWSAYKDSWLLDIDDSRCAPSISEPSDVHLRTIISNDSVDLMENDIWSILPVRATHNFPCRDSIPFDENSNCLVIDGTGVPCDINCYSPLFLSYDNVEFQWAERSNPSQGNVCETSGGCLQVGQQLNPHDIPIASTGTIWNYYPSQLTIPRDDTYSVARFYNYVGDFGEDFDSGADSFYSVEKLAYKINWDDSNGWWSGNFKFLGASGSSCGVATNGFSGYNFGNLYKGGDCETYDLYLYRPCNQLGLFVDIYDGDENLYSTSDFSTSDTEANNVHSLLMGHSNIENGLIEIDGSTVSIGKYATSIAEKSYNYTDNPFLGDSLSCTGECSTSGFFSYSLKGISGYDIADKPAFFMDSMGCVAIRSQDFFADNRHTIGVPYLGRDLALGDYPGPECSIAAERLRVYELGSSESINLVRTEEDLSFILDASIVSCGGGGNLGYWVGNCIGKVSALGSGGHGHGLVASFDGSSLDDMAVQIQPCRVIMFYDQNNSNIKAIIRPLGPLPNTGAPAFIGNNSSEYYIAPSGFLKSQSDIINNEYFAEVTIVGTNPLKLDLVQYFMAFGVPNDGTLETDCTKYRMYYYKVELTLEQPTSV